LGQVHMASVLCLTEQTGYGIVFSACPRFVQVELMNGQRYAAEDGLALLAAVCPRISPT
jgi:hypothetical protein